jgi:hypothetical protein
MDLEDRHQMEAQICPENRAASPSCAAIEVF